MFSDRGWILKLAAILALLAGLLADARRQIAVAHPHLERVALYDDSLRNRTIYVWGRRVQAVEPGGFQLNSTVGPIHVRTEKPLAVGDYVSVIGRPVGPRTVEAIRLQVNEGFVWKRPLNYAVSVVTLLVYLWLIRSRFRWRIHEGVFRSRY